MDSVTNTMKRKKRKTRKCLDEIRKRSRRTSQIIMEKDKNRVGDLYSRNVQHCMITDNRLTLRMFPNAICSKTITRPGLLDLENNPNMKLAERLKDVEAHSNTKSRLINFSNSCNFKAANYVSNNFELQNVCNKETIVKNTEESIELFSSMDELNNKSPNSVDTQSVSTVTSSSTPSFRHNYAYSLYEEFMSQVPSCIQKNLRLAKEDVVKKTKIVLQNLYIESCYKEHKNNILNCMRQGTQNNMQYTNYEIVHDPMSYIRLNRLQQENNTKVNNSITGSGSTCYSPPDADPGSSVTSPSYTILNVIIKDTPDYTFYPHKLN